MVIPLTCILTHIIAYFRHRIIEARVAQAPLEVANGLISFLIDLLWLTPVDSIDSRVLGIVYFVASGNPGTNFGSYLAPFAT